MSLSAMVQALMDVGATKEMVVAAIHAFETSAEEKAALQREGARQRKIRSREKLKSLYNNDAVTNVTVTPVTSVTETPSPLVPPNGFPTPLPITPLNPPIPRGERKARVTLAELSSDHIRDWLAKKRTQGRYIHHDEEFVLEQLHQYCESKGVKYDDYTAAYRNAFEWAKCIADAQRRAPQLGKPDFSAKPLADTRSPARRAADEAERIIAERRARREAESTSLGQSAAEGFTSGSG